MITNSRFLKRRNVGFFAQLPVLLAASCLSLAGGLSVAFAADEVAGKALALQWCAACHLVAEDQASVASTSLPSFYDIAGDPLWTEDKLATFLADPHPKMPDMSLKTIEIVNLAKYISSLKR